MRFLPLLLAAILVTGCGLPENCSTTMTEKGGETVACQQMGSVQVQPARPVKGVKIEYVDSGENSPAMVVQAWSDGSSYGWGERGKADLMIDGTGYEITYHRIKSVREDRMLKERYLFLLTDADLERFARSENFQMEMGSAVFDFSESLEMAETVYNYQ